MSDIQVQMTELFTRTRTGTRILLFYYFWGVFVEKPVAYNVCTSCDFLIGRALSLPIIMTYFLLYTWQCVRVCFLANSIVSQ